MLDKGDAAAKVQEAKGVDLISRVKTRRVEGVEAYCALYMKSSNHMTR